MQHGHRYDQGPNAGRSGVLILIGVSAYWKIYTFLHSKTAVGLGLSLLKAMSEVFFKKMAKSMTCNFGSSMC